MPLLSALPLFSTPPGLDLQLLIAGLWLGLVLLATEAVSRFSNASPEVVRKVLHMGAGNVILLAWWLQIPAWIGIAASVVASTIALLSYHFPILTSVNGIGRHSWGTFFYAVSIGILVAWFWPLQQPQYAALGILVMTWGDGMAALIGQRFGRHPYQVWGMQKSWEGSLAMVLTSWTICSLILLGVQANLWEMVWIPLAVAAVATLLETFSKLGIDNLTVPLGSAALAFALGSLL
ncbi:phosphatidate cytidylyltransferase [Leptolyngbya sp. 'hensonii']|uniref:diacylglycerol/polyprenol kinase family protein n=1 Tax=Leptolyngbya sp. 'hensonii' TaxID=1922337 RepID=UPI00095012AF|nr:diacylglycerol/polyprenol kinase family protein [Leptolyngbya sp. 'hensonii']OLP17112.1 phosphatidate cytidylyltransferase [Leptolyngbya sp. 'hensonii']